MSLLLVYMIGLGLYHGLDKYLIQIFLAFAHKFVNYSVYYRKFCPTTLYSNAVQGKSRILTKCTDL